MRSGLWLLASDCSAPKEIILIHHTDCGMLTFTDDEFKEGIRKELA